MKRIYSGSHAADMMGADHDTIFKTLVLKGEKTGYLVCCIPVDEELDLKKVAKAAHDKKVEMIPMKDLPAADRLYSGRMFSHWNEEKVSLIYRRNSDSV